MQVATVDGRILAKEFMTIPRWTDGEGLKKEVARRVPALPDKLPSEN